MQYQVGVRPAGRPRAPAGRAVPVLVAVALVLVGAAAVVSTGRDQCTSRSPSVLVALDPALADALGGALGAEQRTDAGACVRVAVAAQRPAEVAEDLAAGEGPQVWVPDSAVSALSAVPGRGGAAPRLEVGASLARTPLVALADAEAVDRAGWRDRAPSWREIVTAPTALAVPDPAATGEGLLGLLSVAADAGVPDPGAPTPELMGALVQLGRSTAPTVQDLLDRPRPAPTALVTEQAALHRTGTAEALAVVYPAGGSVALDHPVVRVRRPAERPDADEAVAVVQRALAGPAVRQALAAAGFRDPSGRLDPALLAGADGAAAVQGVRPDEPPSLPPPPVEVVPRALELWAAVTRPARMLLAVDVSGSMAVPLAPGTTRLDVARNAGLGGLALFPDRSELGVWAFSSQLRGGDDWLSLAPLAPLGSPSGPGTHRQQVQAALGGIATLAGGGTGLYDTAVAATREVRREYRDGATNNVVLFTDGRNEDDAGLDLPTAVEVLRREVQPARPVTITAIGLGPDVDLPALAQLAEATGGRAYQADSPAVIPQVFFDAFVRR